VEGAASVADARALNTNSELPMSAVTSSHLNATAHPQLIWNA
jgi:hypothetical protein